MYFLLEYTPFGKESEDSLRKLILVNTLFLCTSSEDMSAKKRCLQDKLVSADKLSTKVENVGENELDDDKRVEKQAILKTIEDVKHRLQVSHF